MKNEITFNAVGFNRNGDNINFADEPQKVVLSPNGTGNLGRLVTKDFAIDAITSFDDYIKKPNGDIFKNVRRINFSKTLIQLILAQEKSEGITIFFCLPPSAEFIDSTGNENITLKELNENRKLSVLLMGIDRNGKPLSTIEPLSEEIDNTETILVEIGGHDNPIIDNLGLTGIQYFS